MPSAYESAVIGRDLYNYFGNRVVESRTSGGRLVAVKVKPKQAFKRSEADMMDYASRQRCGILAPRVLGCYKVDPSIFATVSDLVPGVSLDTVWHEMDDLQQGSIKAQLKEQVRLFRTCTQPYIGRVNRQPIRNFYEGIEFATMGPFDDEIAFDEWCLQRIKSRVSRFKWKHHLSKMRGRDSKTLVLTHGDLAARNILVKDGKITGIVDWEYSGFFPEYMEYARAFHMNGVWEDDWWKPILLEILEPCEPQRLKFYEAITNRGY